MDSDRKSFVPCRCGVVVETTSLRCANTSYPLLNPLCNKCLRVSIDNSHLTQVRRSSDDREWDLFHQETHSNSSHGEDVAGHRTLAGDLPDSTITESFQSLAIQSCGTVPQQESCSDSRDPQITACHVESISPAKFPVQVTEEHGGPDVGRFCSNLGSECEHCVLVLFKRGIISREDLAHVLYILPKEKFSSVFPRIKQLEAVVCHGTEFPMGEESRPMCECSLFHDLFITDELTVHSEMVSGKNFKIANSSMQVLCAYCKQEDPAEGDGAETVEWIQCDACDKWYHQVCAVTPLDDDMFWHCTFCIAVTSIRVSQVKAASVARIDPGVKVKLSITCTGSKDALWKDSVRLTLQTGETTLRMIFATACHETNISPWLYDCSSVTRMPDEDRQALRSCHVDLIRNIGDVLSICEYFYQHGIFDGDDIDELKSICKTRERIADFLRRLPTRGNILDLLVDIMRCQRENQGAADILLQKRVKSHEIFYEK